MPRTKQTWELAQATARELETRAYQSDTSTDWEAAANAWKVAAEEVHKVKPFCQGYWGCLDNEKYCRRQMRKDRS